MIFDRQLIRIVILCTAIFFGLSYNKIIIADGIGVSLSIVSHTELYSYPVVIDPASKEIGQLNSSLLAYLKADDLANAKLAAAKVLDKIWGYDKSDSLLSESYYLVGVSLYKEKEFFESSRYLHLCISLKGKNNVIDVMHFRALYNLSLAYYNLGDLIKCEIYALKSIEIGKQVYGESSPELEVSYLMLLAGNIEMNEYEKALNNSDIAINIANKNPGKVASYLFASIYSDMGVYYMRLGNFSKAKIYYEKSESLYRDLHIKNNEGFISLMDGLALTYNALDMVEEGGKYYEKGVELAISSNSPIAFNIIINYCNYLAKNKKVDQGEKLLEQALIRAKEQYDKNPRDYIEVLNNFASYLRDNKIDMKKSISCFEECIKYVNQNEQDYLKNNVYLGYSRALKEVGEPEKAIAFIQVLLFPDIKNKDIPDNYRNPPFESLRPDIYSLKILQFKYDLLWDIYKKKADQKTLEAAANTAELVIELLDKLRINISEDKSRLILGDKYRESYLKAIRDFNLLYSANADSRFLEKAFEYSEKSKVAALLASTRELKATQFHIPQDIAGYELQLQKEISALNIRISDESTKTNPNDRLISKYKESLLENTRKRDSLILLFEKQYPEYYAIKYNSRMIDLKDITKIIGRDGNYVNYVISDSVLYTFVVNRNTKRLFAIQIDTSFINDIKHFRQLLSMPLPSDNAAQKFKEFQIVGYRLYKTMIDPIRSSLVSDKILISPDNILSYLPFEALPTSVNLSGAIRYGDINYFMNDFDISYTYSASFLAESMNKVYPRGNNLIAFAPDYHDPIDIKSALMSRQAGMGVLNDLPFARQEAKYITDLTGGTLYTNSDARESVFKNEAGKYDIIHLAMHTLLDDKDPMRSTLIFSQINDSLDDGYLKTYEIYGIPLKAKMVVLSSCNTGAGLLFSGEGILSLARGFIYSGSQSVVMSLWEIEDKSGTEIVERFYKNLKDGYTKSEALKRARTEFLNKSDQLRSHPYFWSSLVVYGNDAPVYFSKKLKIIFIAIGAILLLSLGYYFSKRKYS